MAWFDKKEKDIEEDDEKSEKIDTYSISFICPNCKRFSYYTIEYGVSVLSYFRTKLCDKCGCSLEGGEVNA